MNELNKRTGNYKELQSIIGKMYDYIIVGAGLSGAVHAHELSKIGNVLLVEKRPNVGGNCHTVQKNGIMIHNYGSHIFHTNNQRVWNWVNKFTEFNDYKHRVMANTGEEHVMLPFSMVTFMQIFNVSTVEDVEENIEKEVEYYKLTRKLSEDWEPTNFEEQAIVLVGTTIYEKLIKHYTEKQWGRVCTQLPAEIIKRLPKRWNTDTTYFNNAKYQGIPENGYTDMIENMLLSDKIDIIHTDFLDHKTEILTCLNPLYGQFIYTGAIDELMEYKFEPLEYRSLHFEHKHINKKNYQGTAVVNFTGPDDKFTRITEHKHYSTNQEILDLPTTHYSVEYAIDHIPGKTIPYYPINDNLNNSRHEMYVDDFHKKYPMGVLSGRLANYKYYDMDKTIEEALNSVDLILSKFVTSSLDIRAYPGFSGTALDVKTSTDLFDEFRKDIL